MLPVLLYLICISSLNYVKTARILAVFPIPMMGPQNTFKALIQELVEHGHEIYLVTANPKFTKEDITDKIVAVNVYHKTSRIWQKYINTMTSHENCDIITEMDLTFQATNSIFKEMLKTDEIKYLIAEKNTEFDILLLEASITPLLSFSQVFNAPVILVSSIGSSISTYETFGAPTKTFLQQSIFRRRHYNLTLWEKVTEMYLKLELKYMATRNKQVNLMLREHFGFDFPNLEKLVTNVYALFLNNDPIWAGLRPVPPNIVFIGRVHPNIAEEIPEDLQSFLNKSRYGFVYVSFGSYIKPSLLPPKRLLRILHTLAETPYDVILKWDNDRLAGLPRNVKIYKWLPQTSLLGHPKIKLFVTHGGIQSTFEAISAGVPLIGIPFYSDQWYNTESYVKFHIGLQLDMASLTEGRFTDAINLVLSDESYRNSIIELRSLMFGHSNSSLQHAIWWTEQLSSPYNRRYLRPPITNTSWMDYLEVDFIFFILTMCFILILVFSISMTMIFKYVCKSYSDFKTKRS